MRVEPSLIIRTLQANNGRVRQTARQLGVSPGTVINWRKRSRSTSRGMRYTLTRLSRYSTRPKMTRITTLSAKQQDELVILRRQCHYGADKLAKIVGVDKHSRTIHRFLKAKGLTAPTKNYRRPRYQETTHMYLKNAHSPGKLQMDVKYVTPELSGLEHTVYLYAVIDIWSRWKAGIILPSLDQELAIGALDYLLPRLP